jgi:uncharacterized protein (DUF736 family)
MAEYSNENTGALFRIDPKEKQSDRHPDYNGSVNVGGVEYWLSGWKKVSKKGDTFLSLSIKPKDAKPAAKGRQAAPMDDDMDSCPF